MTTLLNKERVILVLVLVLEIWVFSGSFDKFFNHDSLFYVINRPRSWHQFAQLLVKPDSSQQYRPLTLGAMSLAVPFCGLDPRSYHWIPLVFHLANTCLFFLLARRLMSDWLSVGAAVIFWGLHSVAAWVTYDIGYFPDFLLGFFALSSLILATDGYKTRSPLKAGFALLLYLAALLCKEAMVALPLVLWICLVLSELKDATQQPTFRDIVRISRRAAPLIGLYLAMALAHAARLIHWLQSGSLYAQGPAAAYDINPLANITGKLKYLYWALNLPDHLSIPSPGRNWARAIALMGLVLATWLVAFLRRREKLSPVEVGGLVWLLGMLVPPLLLSSRTAKWYLYFPAMGLALTIGSLTRNLKELLPGIPQQISHAGILAFLLGPVLFSSAVQTRSFLAVSDSAYQSDVLTECLKDFRSAHATLPPQVTLFFLPSFDVDVLRILASEPIDRGQLLELYYPGSKVRTGFAHKGDRLPADYRDRSDIWILYYLDGHLYDVTRPCKQGGRLSLYFLPTVEAKVPPLMEKEPIGGWKLHSDYVNMQIADRGDPLPADYYQRGDLMILQYLMGHFYDVTGYYKGRRMDPCALRVIPGLDKVKADVSRSEFYPSYDSFGTLSGGPVFFPTPEKDIVTQIGGSTAVVSLGRLPDQARLHFDISWMFDQGDGAWAGVAVRYDGREESLFRQYMNPNPKGKGFVWQEVKLDLSSYAGKAVELVLTCRNSPGNTTIADWLNWRDIRLESPKLRGPGC